MTTQEFGTMVKNFRVSKGIDQKQFAKLMGCSGSNLCKIELGYIEPRMSLTIKILKTIVPEFSLYVLKAETEIQYGGI